MRVKRVLRYYCDHCRKGSLSKHAMRVHETHCCRNPERQCRMCVSRREYDQYGNVWPVNPLTTQPLDVLKDALARGGVDALRAVAGGCPACMLAAILQSRPANYSPDDDWVAFDFKAETKRFWASRFWASNDVAF